MTLNSDTKFKEKLTCGFKCDMRNLGKFYATTQKSENFISMDFFFQIYKVWATKIQISYLAWHWKLMQNLNKPWPCGFKNSMKNWCKIVEKLYFDGLFLSKACFSKKISEKLCVMILKGNVKFKRKLTHGLKNDIRNLVNFHASSRKSEICTLIGSFFPKHIKF